MSPPEDGKAVERLLATLAQREATIATLRGAVKRWTGRWEHLNCEGVPDEQRLNFEPPEFRSGNNPNYPTVGDLRHARALLAATAPSKEG